jgi:hypothetical protein
LAATLLSGYPDATTTGVQSGVALKAYNGDLIVNTPGAVISGLDIKGSVIINAPNVTIENCKITFVNYWGVNVKSGVNGTVVQNCEINGTGTSPQGVDGIQGQGTFINNNIYNVENGIAVDGNNTVIKGNYIHDFHASGDPHYDGIQIGGALSNITISHNTIVNQQHDTSAVYITNDWGPVNGVIVDDNQLIGAGYTVYSDEKGGGSGPQITGVQFTNNKLGSGYWGFADISNNTVVWQGNTEIGSGKTVSVDGTLSSLPATGPATGLDAPQIAGWTSDTGVAGDGITNDNTLALKGAAAANSTVKIFDGGKQIGSVTADGSGAWKFTSAALTDGNHSLTATATSGGVTSSASSPLALVIDTAAPNVPTLKLSTSASNLASTHVAKLDGTAEAKSTVKVLDGTTQIGIATANSSGVWTFTTGTLANGNHNFTAQATDVAGNTGAASTPLPVKVLLSDPSAPTASDPSAPTGPDAPPTPTPGKVIESAGATSLVESSDKYYLNSSSGSGPSLKYHGVDFVDGTDGTWSPIAAEKTTTGYQVVWKEASTGLYTAWNTDNSGNYVSHVSALTGSTSGGMVSGTNSGLKLLETSFHQDLNGDGQIGASSATAPTQINSTDKVVAASGETMVGTDRSDTLTSTTGNDIMAGKGNSDTFVFAPNFGNDVINDFQARDWGHDAVQFSKSVFDNFADVLAHATQAGGNVVIAADHGDSLTLKNVKLAALDKSDFHFV